jgi:inosose dehydratase
MAAAPRIALSPSAWGISDAPRWGFQPAAEHVLGEVAKLGVKAIEAGPQGFLPDHSGQARRLLKHNRMTVAAGPVRAILHHHDIRGAELAHIDGHAAWLAALGAETLVLIAIPTRDADQHRTALSSTGWAHLLHSIGSVEHVCSRHHLRVAVQSEFGSMIHGPGEIETLLVGSEAGICIDTAQLMLGGADPLDVLELAAGRVRHVRLADIDLGTADLVAGGDTTYGDAVRQDLFKPLGTGDAKIERIVETVRQSDYRGWYAIDEPKYAGSDQAHPNVRQSVDFLFSLLA